MTTKEYLQQAYRLDKRINSHIKELGELKSMAAAISSPQITADKVQTTPSGDPPYVSALMRIWEMEEKIKRLKVRKGMSVRPVLVYDGTLDPQLSGRGYFAATIDAATLLEK